MTNRLKAKGIFLDLDGTIVDSTEAYVEAARIAFQAAGQKPPQKMIALEIPRRLEQGVLLKDITETNLKGLLRLYFDAYYSVTEAKTKLLPNVSETLEVLSQHAKLALITMRHVPSQVIQKELDYFGISKFFTHIITALDTSKPKPSPEALIQGVRSLKVEIRDCIIAGDSVSDIRAGKAGGAQTVGVLSGLFGREELEREHPDLILSDIAALPAFVE
jgi:phosphoglycolate phosphatase